MSKFTTVGQMLCHATAATANDMRPGNFLVATAAGARRGGAKSRRFAMQTFLAALVNFVTL
jgi:hypothetical protein